MTGAGTMARITVHGVDSAAELQALQACIVATMSTADGRAVRGARITCRNALVRAGRTPSAAQELADAAARVGAQTMRAQFGIGRTAQA